tara:strand:+ start:2472 stop:2657 length:186 start_codon:yes stop_codon:yes gene_type:complete
MLDEKVGKIKNIKYNSDDESLEIIITITDSKFKKKLLRDLSLMGKITFSGDDIVFNANKEE